MTETAAEGFDAYANGTDFALECATYASAGFLSASSTAFGLGQCGSGLNFTRQHDTLAHEVTINFTLRAKWNSPVTPSNNNLLQVTMVDGTDVQCTLEFNAIDRSIKLWSGTNTGTLLGTATLAFQLNLWNSYQGTFVINNATGTFVLYKDGDTSTPLLNLSGVNTRGPVSTHNYSTHWGVVSLSSWILDDVMMNNSDGTAPTGLPLDYRCVVTRPAGATATTDFSASPATLTYGQLVATDATGTISGNTLIFVPFTPTVGGSVTAFDVNLLNSLTGHMIGGIADNTGTGGGPGALLQSTSVVTNPTAGHNTFTLGGTVSLLKGVQYWIVLQSDTNYQPLATLNGGGATQTGVSYSGSLPSSFAASTGSIGHLPNISIIVTNFKWSLVNWDTEQGDTYYLSSATVGNEELFSMSSLPVTPTSIVGVKPRLFLHKSDAGPRSASMRLIANASSDTSIVNGPLSSSGNFFSKFMPLDPTGAAWTASHVNGANLGIKVDA